MHKVIGFINNDYAVIPTKRNGKFKWAVINRTNKEAIPEERVNQSECYKAMSGEFQSEYCRSN